MAKIRDIASIGEKWQRVTSERADDYALGVKNPKESWQAQTIAAKEAYKAGIQESIAKDRFARGVSKAGDKKWQERAIGKGVARFGPGVQIARNDYEIAFTPYQIAITGVPLPPRYSKGDLRNLERVKAVTTTLRTKKVGA